MFCIDDGSRIAFTDILPNEKAASAIAFLKAAMHYYESLGITGHTGHDRQQILLHCQGFREGL